ncbi:hypothetical protein A4G20_01985 [Pasteurellaceae bacterium RH1A]|nr:hypothetical protein A4G20_01985 [Pasteurellaceae bacterium RH1A]
MNFDLSQLLQGPVRELILNQVSNKFGLSHEQGGNLLTKGLSMVLGGMAQQAGSKDGASNLFDLIKNVSLEGNPLDVLAGKSNLAANSHLIDMAKNLLPSIFGSRADSIVDHLANSNNTTPMAVKGLLGALVPVVLAFFKNKIAGGLGLAGFASLLGEQTKKVAGNLDSSSLAALGFTGASFNDVLGNVAKVAGLGAAATGAATAAKATVAEEKKSGGLGKWLLGAAVLLAAFFGIKSCSDKQATTTTAAPANNTAAAPAPEAKPATNVEVAPKTVDGLGNLAWLKTDKDFTVSGTVNNEGVKTSILDAFKGLAGSLPLVDKLVVDANAPQSSFSNFAGLAGLFKDFPGVSGAFVDTTLNLLGQVESGEAKASLLDKAKAVLGNLFAINTDGVKVADPIAKLVDGLGNFGWAQTAKGLALSGTVNNDGVKASILDGFKGLNLPVLDELVVDANATQSNFTNFAGLAGLVKDFPGVKGSFADTVLNLVGQVSKGEEKVELAAKAKALLGDAFSINTDEVTIAQAVEAEEPAAEVIADMNAAKLNLDIVFNTGSADISPRYFNRLNAFAKHLIENNRSGEISGFTDNTGNAEANQKLSEARANAVRNYLLNQGVPADALNAVGYGQANPVADNGTAEGRAQNRRIEFNAR